MLAIHDQICWLKSIFSLWKSIQVDHKCCNCLRMRFFVFFSIQNSIDWIHFVVQRIVIAFAKQWMTIQDKPYHKNNSNNTNNNNNVDIYYTLCKIIFSHFVCACARTKLKAFLYWYFNNTVAIPHHRHTYRAIPNVCSIFCLLYPYISVEITNE